jgi:hypothetical protein
MSSSKHTPGDIGIGGPQTRPASFETVIRAAKAAIAKNRWPLEVTGCSMGERSNHVSLTMVYRGSFFDRNVLVDTHRAMEYSLWRLFDREYADAGGEGSVRVSIRKLDAELPCIACKDAVWNCISCGGRNVVTNHVQPAVAIVHESAPCAGHSLSSSYRPLTIHELAAAQGFPQQTDAVTTDRVDVTGFTFALSRFGNVEIKHTASAERRTFWSDSQAANSSYLNLDPEYWHGFESARLHAATMINQPLPKRCAVGEHMLARVSANRVDVKRLTSHNGAVTVCVYTNSDTYLDLPSNVLRFAKAMLDLPFTP